MLRLGLPRPVFEGSSVFRFASPLNLGIVTISEFSRLT